jgi:hypothetical protein
MMIILVVLSYTKHNCVSPGLSPRDISQYRLLFGVSLLYKDRVLFELQLSYEGRAAVERAK